MNPPAVPPIKFSREFTTMIDQYIEKSSNPTVYGVSKVIGANVETLWKWANKKKKDEKGNELEELARPNFNAVLIKLDQLEKVNKQVDKESLNEQQELFCQLYASDREFFGNGTQAYAEAYHIDTTKPNWYKATQTSASRLLSNAIILKRINEILELGQLNDAFVDKQLAFLIAQNTDLGAKGAAIREYNKLKSRITEKIDHTTKGKELPTPILGGATNVQSNNGNE